MAALYAHNIGYMAQPSARSRAGALLLTLAIILLIALALIRLGLLPEGATKPVANLTAINVSNSGAATPAHAKAKAAAKAAVHPVEPPHPVTQPKVRPPLLSLNMSHADFAAWDISKMTHHSGEGESNASSASGSTYGPGDGPGGAHLFNAEWYREPSPAVLDAYLPPRGLEPGSSGVIACQTIAGNRVDNCQEIGDEPPGSGLARAMRQAAWQFQIRPPRIDGKPIIGAWVRIRYDIVHGLR